eukprot:CAMPEP_0172298864 /NCGR_PEP_ID=MMETSP1058-20130122/1320_1 /TAXON_ID=83371 /ORGANISM="Detonula confervacea, Strain CCMP 353" /LENGTH=557 /DNA_ID=CAMNT_0013008159 /DNA_START=415 /DNA_END=2091 /DNA_ORIENTATION=-
MASTDTRAFTSPLSEQLPSAEKMMPTTADAQTFLIQEKLSLQEHLTQQQGQLMDPPSHVCEWMPTNLLLPPKHAQEGETYLCLPVHLSEASYFKQNEEKEECKDDGYCRTSATQLRLMQLDRYLAAVAPLALSTQRLLFGATQNSDDSNQTMTFPNKRHKNRRSKYERQFHLPMRQTDSHPHRLITSTNSGRVINVLQGEIAHCTPSQADTLVSDDATTCHIVALWSRYSGIKGGEKTTENTSSKVLATMTHIDGPSYEASLRDAVDEHVKYHSMHPKKIMINGAEECKESCSYDNSGVIDMSIHIMGGFNDDEGSSIEITDNILQTFADLFNQCNAYSVSRGLPLIRMTLETCAVTSANDNGLGCPLGRGLGMEVATGNIFLAEAEAVVIHHGPLSTQPSAVIASRDGLGMIGVDGDVQLLNSSAQDSYISALGPEVTLRSIRCWASAFHLRNRNQEGRLHVIHRPNRDYLNVEPFFFGPHPNVMGLLGCSDEELLRLTSTSPEVEKSNFASNVRKSLTYMNGNKSSNVFLDDQPIKCYRVGMNGWVYAAERKGCS